MHAIREFVVENFLYGQGGDQLSDDDSFLGRGLIDSTGVLELVTFLETRFGIRVDDRDLVPANLDSLAKLRDFVARKQSQPLSAN